MSKQITADDILPLIAGLPTHERVRLIRLITGIPYRDGGAVYAVVPPNDTEFSSEEDPLAWEGDGWEEFD